MSKNKLDCKNYVVTIKVSTGSSAKIAISNTFVLSVDGYLTPANYGFVDDTVMFFVNTRTEEIFKRAKRLIVSAIKTALQQHGISLMFVGKDELSYLYCPTSVRVIEDCNGGYLICNDIPPQEFENIPCGYAITYDLLYLPKLVERD